MSPDSQAPRKTEVKISISTLLLEEARRIASRRGTPIAEFHRNCWEAGLTKLVEEDTKLLVHKKVQQGLTSLHESESSD